MTDDNGASAPQVSVVALDFDGVICDSIHECLRLSYAAFRAIEHGDESDPSRILTADLPERPAALFLERRGIVRPAAHFYLLWKWIVDFPERDMAPAAFEEMAREYPQQIEAFGRLFVEWRTELRERFPAEWVRSNPIYPEVRAAWPRLQRVPVYVVTTKDRLAVLQLLHAHQLEVAGVFAAGEFTNKGEALRAIAARENVGPGEILFVDDNAGHLVDAMGVGATVRWAACGYDAKGAFLAPPMFTFSDVVDLVVGGKRGRTPFSPSRA